MGYTSIIPIVVRREFKGRWKRLCRRLGVSLADPDKEFRHLKSLYSKPVRAYHNLDHVAFCLDEFDRINHMTESPTAVELAIWFHHAKYDPKSSRNEEDSANEAAAFCDRAGAIQEAKKKACEIIMASKHTSPPRDKDTQVFTDVDLAILGQEPEVFWAYEKAIAKEYSWVDPAVFGMKRGEILQGFLDRPTLYSTTLFRDLYEAKARRNLHASMSKVRKERGE